MSIEEKIYREKLTLASIVDRFLAFLVDKFLISIVFMIIFWGEISSIDQSYVAIAKFIANRIYYCIALDLCYESLFVFLYGATLGKMLFKIKVFSIQILDRPNFLYSFIRALCKVGGEYFLFYAPFFVVFFSPIQQALHDILGKTLVIKNV